MKMSEQGKAMKLQSVGYTSFVSENESMVDMFAETADSLRISGEASGKF